MGMTQWMRSVLDDDERTIERRDGADRRRKPMRRQRAAAWLIVACFLVLIAGQLLAYRAAFEARSTARLADREAVAALTQLRDERVKSCEADELDRDRERAIGRRFPQAGLPPVPPPRDCEQEGLLIEQSIETLFRIALGDDPS